MMYKIRHRLLSGWMSHDVQNTSSSALRVKLLSGGVDRVTDWCVTGPGFAPRRVQL